MDTRYRDELNIAPHQEFYRGKVRDIYRIGDRIISVASDRISAFDHILPRPIPHKGQVLNQLAAHFLQSVSDIVPIWLSDMPHPIVSLGRYCDPIRIEMVVRGYLAGHAWRIYRSGERTLCGVELPDGLKESDRLPSPIITPATKAETGHDEDISEDEILKQNLIDVKIWEQLKTYTLELFERGTSMAREAGLILVDTKYEFGIHDGKVYLIDEVHTPDSSRYYYLDGYAERQQSGDSQMQLSKEFVREWLIENKFQGLDGQTMPDMPDAFVQLVSERYIQLFEILTKHTFTPTPPIKDADLANILKIALD